jgi:Trk K+ transport system NAD-binding subunit
MALATLRGTPPLQMAMPTQDLTNLGISRLRPGPFLWRVAAFLVVFLLGFVGLLLGVEVSERDIAGSGVAAKAYYALGLFVVGGLDLGVPQGGPLVGRIMLWTSYFVAPLITVSAIVEATLRIIAPLGLSTWWLRDHVVVAGAGRLSLLYIERLRARDRRRDIVVVERDPAHPLIGEMRRAHRAVFVSGDITHDEVLQGLRVHRARRVMLLTGDDFANLDAAAKILERAPRLAHRIVAHVSDLAFMKSVAGSSVARRCDTFNGHEFAAVHLVKERLLTRFHSTPYRDLVVLAGFGRFGKTVLHQLQLHASGSFGKVVIVDLEATKGARQFDEEPGFGSDYEHAVIDGDILDPNVRREIAEVVARDGHEPVIVVGSGNDGTNLHAALTFEDEYPGAYIIARSFRPSSFTAEVAREAGIMPFNLAELIADGMPEEWFRVT